MTLSALFHQKRFTGLLIVVGLMAFPQTLLAAGDLPGCQTKEIRGCYDGLGNLHIGGKIEQEAATRIDNALMDKVMTCSQALSDHCNNKDDHNFAKIFFESRSDFDLLVETISQRQEKGDWTVDEPSAQIINRCTDALHPGP